MFLEAHMHFTFKMDFGIRWGYIYMFLLLTDVKLFCALKRYFTNCGPPYNCPRHVFTGTKCIFTINDVIPVGYSKKK